MSLYTRCTTPPHTHRSLACLNCPAGSYQDLAQQMGCKLCSTGTHQLSIGSASESDCDSCPIGWYCVTPASKAICPIGSHCSKGSQLPTACSECTVGFEVSVPCSPETDAQCEMCDRHEYSVGGNSNCIACGANEIATEGQSACIPCPGGHYRDLQMINCSQCPGNQYSVGGGAHALDVLNTPDPTT